MTWSRRATSPHQCPWCRCEWEDGYGRVGIVNRDAPGYPLVAEVDALAKVHQPPRNAFKRRRDDGEEGGP